MGPENNGPAERELPACPGEADWVWARGRSHSPFTISRHLSATATSLGTRGRLGADNRMGEGTDI